MWSLAGRCHHPSGRKAVGIQTITMARDPVPPTMLISELVTNGVKKQVHPLLTGWGWPRCGSSVVGMWQEWKMPSSSVSLQAAIEKVAREGEANDDMVE